MSRYEELEQSKSSHYMAEEKLRESEKRFSIIFNTNPDAIALARLSNSQLMDVNKAWQEMTGYTHSEAVGHTAVELNLWVVPKQRDRMVKILHERGVAREEVQVRRKSGEIIEVLMSAEIIELSGGNHLLTMAQDITERKKAEEALRESETKYRSMMEAFADPLYICSPDFTVEYMNPAMIRRTGEATGDKCYHALHGLEAKCDWCVFEKVSRGEKVETTIKSPLDERNYRITHMPIQNQDGTISKMTILRDITDYLQAVSEKKIAQAQLLQARKMESIGNLAGGIAHDFNNILSSILGFAELAFEEVQKGTTLEEGLQEIYSAGNRAKDLVKQILSFARQSDEKRSPIKSCKIVKEVLKFIRSVTPTAIEIRQDIESDALIMGNATQVHQVLMNLCTNAAHAMEDAGGILRVSLKDMVIENQASLNKIGLKQGDYVEIKVSDTGVGIAPEIIGSIFDPYFTTKEPGEGTGMGLAIAHGVVESYGGKITVDSRLGKGTTFTIYLPVAKSRAALGAYLPEQLPLGTERILFVDDEYPIVKLGSKMLERLGYSATARTSSIEALELFRVKPHTFDLVITDMTMPNLTGDKFAVELMKIRHDIPIILCTGYSQRISEETALEIGIKAFVYKPMVKADLARTVRRVLDDAKPER